MNTSILFKKKYDKFYNYYPKKILECFTIKGNGFFYPSSILAEQRDSYYSQSKSNGEKMIKNFKNNKFVKIMSLRLPGLKTKQNVTLLENKYPFFSNFLENNLKLFKGFLFE